MRFACNSFSGLTAVSFILWFVFAALAPPQLWLDVRSVVVANTRVGVQPTMNVDRSINQPFIGTYLVDVEKKMPNGRYSVVCSVHHTTSYNLDADLPEPLKLDWWTWPETCVLDAGRYRVETSWRIEPPLFPDKIITVMSNTFEVTP